MNYDAPVAEYLRERIQPGALCYDVGANIGVYVLQLTRWAGSAGRVVAFEPNPEARRVLERHVRWNHVASRVEIVPEAVSEAPGLAQLHAAGADGMARLGTANPALRSRAKQITVPVTSLDVFSAERQQPDWIIIDVEGYELGVLRGARRLLDPGGPRPRVIVEMHPDQWRGVGETRETAAALLRELKLRPVCLTGQSDGLAEHGNVALEPE
jgi:FkbM family methyltransferase